MVLIRDGFKVIELAQCGLSPEQRFTFYDHVHTTGMDIKQPLSCTACLTFGRDTTLRDYAQGAYRMRGIGRGQRIELLMIPEVVTLIRDVSEVGRVGPADLIQFDSNPDQRLCVDALAWLTLNMIRIEAKKHRMLAKQNLHNLWRYDASSWLEAAPEPEVLRFTWLTDARTVAALRELRCRLDFMVSSLPPGEAAEGLDKLLRRELDEHTAGGAFQNIREQAEEILEELAPPPASPVRGGQAEPSLGDVLGEVITEGEEKESGELELEGEQVQEQEQEQEEEQQREQEQEQEQELEVEAEAEKVVEGAVDRAYARDDEGAKGWPLSALAFDPADVDKTPPFYTISEFTVNKGVFGKSANALQGLPNFVLLSQNYYKSSWRFSSVRRLRNVICFLEWVPSVKNVYRFEYDGEAAVLTPTQAQCLREAFELQGGSFGDEKCVISGQQLKQLLKELDLDDDAVRRVLEASSMSLIAKEDEVIVWSLQKLEEELGTERLYCMQRGRYYVALCLEEAEHLRAALHLLQSREDDVPSHLLPQDCGLALRCLGLLESALADSLIDSYGPVLKSAETGYQLETAEQLLRFTNSSADFEERQMRVLLRALQRNPISDREPWWSDIRSCRRRKQRPWDELTVAKVLIQEDVFNDFAGRALLAKIRWTLAACRLWAADVFRMLDSDGSGGISRGELASGLSWLRLGPTNDLGGAITPERWQELVKYVFHLLDVDKDNRISLEEFRAGLELTRLDWAAVPAIERPAGRPARARQVAPIADVIQHLSNEVQKAATASSFIGQGSFIGASSSTKRPSVTAPPADEEEEPEQFHRLPREVMPRHLFEKFKDPKDARFKLRLQVHEKFKMVWSSAGTQDEPLSLWAPKLAAAPANGIMRVSLGHFACKGMSEPKRALVLEIQDQGEGVVRPDDAQLKLFVEVFLPLPMRYHQVWRLVTAPQKLYIWEPVPPSEDFVPLGMVATTEDVEPPAQACRCAPVAWVEKMEGTRVTKIWADSGASGAAVRFWAPIRVQRGAAITTNEVLFWATAGPTAQVAPSLWVMPSAAFAARMPPDGSVRAGSS